MAKKLKLPQVDFDSLLVLFRFFLNEIGVQELISLSRVLNNQEYEGMSADGYSYFHEYIAALPSLNVDRNRLRQYDENIIRCVRHIGEKRGGVRLKYFQYLSLLFTEMYLDRYFSDRTGFVEDLNQWLDAKRRESDGGVFFSDYSPEQLNKLAFMCATGSGKTLIMHVNIMQYLHYFKRARRSNPSMSLNRIILVTPNEGMSRQHKEELDLSGIGSKIFAKDGILSAVDDAGEVLIIDINKFADEMGDKTVAVDAFESNNLVLVDEAHRGLTSGDVWVGYRRRISAEGFSFEYSATFKQSLDVNSNKASDRNAIEEYGKSIIMDYSYKYFYNDGYGKDYRIYNLNSSYGDDSRQMYLTGCLLSFYQQMKFYEIHRSELTARYHIEKPLLVFVGNKVTATTGQGELSDVQEVIAFIDSFVHHRSRSVKMIDDILHMQSGLVNDDGSDLFEYGLNVLTDDIYAGVTPDASAIFADMLRLIFNTSTDADEPRMRIENIKQVQGEIALRIGESPDCFGVINIGAPSKLIVACERSGIVTRTEEFGNRSLFHSINDRDSTINILIGSRKFTEGWNSWRVSAMGLINFAKSEGSQAIQLFGRGVRLRGIDGCLKRSSQVEGRHLRHIDCMETLTIFGVKAQYMEVFKNMMAEEGAPVNDNFREIRLPVVSRYDEARRYCLKVIRVKPGIDFRKQSCRLLLDAPSEEFKSYLLKSVTRIDCQSRVQRIVSKDILQISMVNAAQYHPIPKEYLPMLDYYRIYDELIAYKNERGYYNITLLRDKLIDILRPQELQESPGWYELIIPGARLDIREYAGLEMLTDFAILALKSYMDKFYRYEKLKWEAPFLEYTELSDTDNNFVDGYTVRYTSSSPLDTEWESLSEFMRDVADQISVHGCLPENSLTWKNTLTLSDFKGHLYTPLLSMRPSNHKLQIAPVCLNEGEQQFVDMLRRFTEEHTDMLSGKSLFLLRNKSKAGMGFFEASNFYPDFILWIDTPDVQYITFIDPKGLLRILPGNDKIQFYRTIKGLEARLQPASGEKKIVLNSFIMSSTPAVKLKEWWHMDRGVREAMNVYTLDNPQAVYSMISKVLSEQ